MNPYENTFHELVKRAAATVGVNARQELPSKQGTQLCKDGKIRGRRRTPSEWEYINKFWKTVKIGDANQCWEWSGKRSSNYGWMVYNGRPWKAHRLSLLFSGEKLENLFVCHKCDNPPCCNPNHLFTGTPRDNNLDASRKGRLKGAGRGELNHKSKLTEENVREIKDLFSKKEMTITMLSRKYKVTWYAIKFILIGKNWAHIK